MDANYTSLLASCIHWGFTKTRMNGPHVLMITTEEEGDVTVFLTILKNKVYIITFGPIIYLLPDPLNLHNLLSDLRKSGVFMVSFSQEVILTHKLEQIKDISLAREINLYSSEEIVTKDEQQYVLDSETYIAFINRLKEKLGDRSEDRHLVECCRDALAYIYLHDKWSDFMDFSRSESATKSGLV